MASGDAGSLSSIRGTWGPERAGGTRRTVKPAKTHKQEIIIHTDPEDAFNVEDNPSKLTEFEIQECKEAFDNLDVSERGTIAMQDLEKLLEILGLESCLPEVQDLLLEKRAQTGNDAVSFSECLCLVAKMRKEKDDEDLREAFFMLDSGHTGSIGASEVKQMMQSLGHSLTDDEAIEMVREADTTGNGRIAFQEFCNMMKKS